jgi:uncharacterized YccA/Bax inhibitor family protein
MIRTANPALRAKAFETSTAYDSAMSLNGTINKSFILLLLVVLGAMFVWSKPETFAPFMIPAIIVTLILALITIFKKTVAFITAPIYALCEGVVLGVISSLFERSYPGIVIQAVGLTFGVLFCMLMLYRSGIIKVTQKFKMGIFAATGAIMLLYLVNMFMGFFGGGMGFLHASTPMGILISVAICTIAALNLVLKLRRR